MCFEGEFSTGVSTSEERFKPVHSLRPRLAGEVFKQLRPEPSIMQALLGIGGLSEPANTFAS